MYSSNMRPNGQSVKFFSGGGAASLHVHHYPFYPYYATQKLHKMSHFLSDHQMSDFSSWSIQSARADILYLACVACYSWVMPGFKCRYPRQQDWWDYALPHA